MSVFNCWYCGSVSPCAPQRVGIHRSNSIPMVRRDCIMSPCLMRMHQLLASTCHLLSTVEYRAPTWSHWVTLAGHDVGIATLTLATKTVSQLRVCALVQSRPKSSISPFFGVPVGAAMVTVPATPVICISHAALLPTGPGQV